MKTFPSFLAAGALMLGAAGVATPASAQSARQVAKGAAIGGAGGAVAGAVVPGLGVGEGALIGAAGGAAVTALTKNGDKRKYHRDSRGRQYWVDKQGRRRYR